MTKRSIISVAAIALLLGTASITLAESDIVSGDNTTVREISHDHDGNHGWGRGCSSMRDHAMHDGYGNHGDHGRHNSMHRGGTGHGHRC